MNILIRCLSIFLLSNNGFALQHQPPSIEYVVLNKAGGGMQIYQFNTGKTLNQYSTSSQPHETALSPSGRFVVIANTNFPNSKTAPFFLTILDRWLKATFKIPLPKYVYPHGLAFISEHQVAVTAQGSLNGAIVDLSLKQVIKNLNLGDRACHLLVVAPQKKQLYLTCPASNEMVAYNLVQQKIIKVWHKLPQVEPIAINQAETNVWLGLRGTHNVIRVDLVTGKVAKTYQMSDEPIRLLLTNKEDKLVVIGLKKGVIAQLDSKTLQPLSVTQLRGNKPSELISMANTADPNKILIGDQGNQRVIVWDLAKRKTFHSWPATPQPDGIRYLPPIPPRLGTLQVLASKMGTLAHEGPFIWRDSLYFFSKPQAKAKNIIISKFDLKKKTRVSIHPSKIGLTMPNGAYKRPNSSIVYVTDQGNKTKPAGVYQWDLSNNQTRLIVGHYQGKVLNSPNDVTYGEHALWFTDPTYGYQAGFRPKPQLPAAVWHYELSQKKLSQLTTIPEQPNGIALSISNECLIVSDTSYALGSGGSDPKGHRSISAYQLKNMATAPVAGKHLWQTVFPSGIPDGIKLDGSDRLFAAAGDGLYALSVKTGKVIGFQPIDGGAVNLAIEKDRIYILTNDTVQLLTLEK